MTHNLAVGAMIVNKDDKILLIKRADDEVHKPGAWEFSSGRLEPDENPVDGLKREVREETNLEVEILNPLGVHYFTRDDGQKITLIIFLCKALTEVVKLSHEHTEHKWLSPEDANEIVFDAYVKEIELYLERYA